MEPGKMEQNIHFCSSDYNYVLETEDELDDDNLLASMFRKNIPTTSVFVKSITLKHEQFLAKDFNLKASLDYKQLAPAFNFAYHPISKISNLPIDSLYANKLPVAQASIGLRYSKNQRYIILNYDQVRLVTYNPVLTFNYTYGINAGNAQFTFQKVNIGVEHKLRLPPKAIFYYNITAGKTFGTAPYLLLDVP